MPNNVLDARPVIDVIGATLADGVLVTLDQIPGVTDDLIDSALRIKIRNRGPGVIDYLIGNSGVRLAQANYKITKLSPRRVWGLAAFNNSAVGGNTQILGVDGTAQVDGRQDLWYLQIQANGGAAEIRITFEG